MKFYSSYLLEDKDGEFILKVIRYRDEVQIWKERFVEFYEPSESEDDAHIVLYPIYVKQFPI